jgi:hypothetical protein
MSFVGISRENINEIKGFCPARLLLCNLPRDTAYGNQAGLITQEVHIVKKLSTIGILSIAATFALATSSFSGPVPNSGGSPSVDAATIAQLQVAAKQAAAEGRKGGKTNVEYLRKNYEINLLIDRLQSGQQVDPSDIDKALEAPHMW